MDESRQAYRERAAARFREYSGKVDDLVARAGKGRAGGRIELHERVRTLRARRDVARKRLAELEGSAADAWVQLKDGMAQSLRDLEEATRTLQRRFREEERLERAARG